jgi:group I intron endonuclease
LEINSPERKVSGVYAIIHLESGKAYIGSAVRVRDRIKTHYSLLKLGKHHSVLLQRAWNKYGADAFRFTVLEQCHVDSLIEREQYHLNNTRAYDPRHGYNICPTAGSSLGVKQPAELSARKSELAKKMNADPVFRERQRQAVLGNKFGSHPHTDEFKEKRRQHMLGNKLNLGRKRTPEEVEYRRQLMLGNQYTKGRVMPEHEKSARSAALKGRPKSPEARENIRLAIYKRFQKSS